MRETLHATARPALTTPSPKPDGHDPSGRFPGERVGVALAIVGTALFATKSILIKWAYGYGVDTTTLLTLRLLMAAPIYLLVLGLLLRGPGLAALNRRNVPLIAALGACGYYVASWLDLHSLNFISAHYERLVLFTYPAFVLLLNSLVNRRKVHLREVIALVIAYAGLALIFAHDLASLGDHVLIGTALVLGSALSFSFYVIGSQRLSVEVGSRLFTCIAMLGASAAIFTHFGLQGSFSTLAQPPAVIGIVALIALVATVLPSFMINAAIVRIGANQTAILGSTGPVVTALLAVLLLDEVFTLTHAAGMALVLAGMMLLARGKRSRPRVTAPPATS